MKVLLTGGTGYIGSHTMIELLELGYEVVVVDDFENSKPEVIENIKELTNRDFDFYEGNVCYKETLEQIFEEHKIDAVMHFAGYKAVGESVKNPLKYYRNNIDSTLTLLEVMDKYKCKNIVFSSSATVYKKTDMLPIKENFSLSTTSAYANSKLLIENILENLYISDSEWNITILRYFNPLGAHGSGLIGENPNDIPNNLMPYVVQVAIGNYECLNIFGNDYNTHDGTGVRDYVHVVDLAKGHVKALENFNGINIYNLGTGIGYSVLDVVNTFEKATGIPIPYRIVERRPGDIDEYYADASKAKKELGWVAEKNLEDMCRDAYNYVLKNNEKNMKLQRTL